MTLYFGSFLAEALAILVLLFITVYFYFQNAYKYWESRGVPTSKISFPFGHMKPVLFQTESLGCRLQAVYNELKCKSKYIGWYSFSKPLLILTDPGEIKNVLVRDFNNFQDRRIYFNEKDDPLSAHFFTLEGQKWRSLRAKLTPTFTSGKMKYMYPTMLECAENLNIYLKDVITKNNLFEMKDIFARYSTDVIGSCAFGIDCNSLSNPNAEFKRYGERIFKRTLTEALKFPVIGAYIDLSKKLGITKVNREVARFFMQMVKDTINYREKNNIRRKDFMDLLIQLKNFGQLEDGTAPPKNIDINSTITIEEAAAQAFVFFLAGFEPSSTAMSLTLYELAINPDIQEKVRLEINMVLKKHGEKMSYEALLDMPYLDRVIYETMRKYPPLTLLTRYCLKDYKIPDSDIVIKKGVKVLIPVLGLHHDPKYFPDPQKFDPDRFTEENKAKRHPFTYFPFGEGPRRCIAIRFGMLQVRLGVISVVRNFSLKNSDKTLSPLKFDPKIKSTAILGGIWLELKELA